MCVNFVCVIKVCEFCEFSSVVSECDINCNE